MMAPRSRAAVDGPAPARETGPVVPASDPTLDPAVDGGLDPAVDERLVATADATADPALDDGVRCRACDHVLTRPGLAIEVAGAHVRTFRNPAGWSFRVACYRDA